MLLAGVVLAIGLAALLPIEPRTSPGAILWYAAVAALIVLSGLAWGVGRTIATARALRTLVRARLRAGRCAHCDEPMARLPTRPDGAVHCPRCGRRYLEPARLRTAEQLILCDPERHQELLAALPPSAADLRCSCGYPLRDLPTRGVRAQCPECGASHSVLPAELGL